MVSSCSVNVVRSCFSTNFLEILLIEEPESKRQRACEALVLILTSTVGSSITLFCRKIAVSIEDLEVVGKDDRDVLGRASLDVVGGEQERERDDEAVDELANLGLRWRSV